MKVCFAYFHNLQFLGKSVVSRNPVVLVTQVCRVWLYLANRDLYTLKKIRKHSVISIVCFLTVFFTKIGD